MAHIPKKIPRNFENFKRSKSFRTLENISHKIIQKSLIFFCRLKKKCYICSALVHPQRKWVQREKYKQIKAIKIMKLSEMNPREFAQHLKQKYKFFEVYSGLKYIGRGEYIHGYYVIVAGYDNPQDYRRKIEDIADTANGGAILYVK